MTFTYITELTPLLPPFIQPQGATLDWIARMHTEAETLSKGLDSITKEAFFVKNIIQTHPGMRAVSEEYAHALGVFLSILTGTYPAIDFRSRRQLSSWFKTQYSENL